MNLQISLLVLLGFHLISIIELVYFAIGTFVLGNSQTVVSSCPAVATIDCPAGCYANATASSLATSCAMVSVGKFSKILVYHTSNLHI
jgi:hypothetical protein